MNEYKNAKEARQELFTEIEELKVQFHKDKKEGMLEINKKEREKIMAIRRLNEEMDYKIKEMQANMRAMNDEQLQTQTRSTIMQNHQLTTELDNQSKNTE